MLFRFAKHLTGLMVPVSAAVILTLPVRTAYGQYYYQSAPCPAPVLQPAPCPAPVVPSPAPAQQPQTPAAPLPQQQQPSPIPQTAPETAQAPSVSPEAVGAGGGGETFAAAAPQVIGDGGVSAFGQINVSTGNSVQQRSLAAAVQNRVNAFKITENQSPRPMNRVYLGYNYFANAQGLSRDIHRETFGWEQTFMDGNASFGAMLPVYQTGGSDLFNIQGFGNLNLIGKYAWINDRTTGNVLTTGMSLTTPTGRGITIPGQSQINDVIFQPWLGYIYGQSGWYAQGFSAIAAPTDARDITILFNDVAVGYWIYRNAEASGLTGVIPTLEAHINTPLNHRGLGSSPFGLQDSVVLTGGTHFVINQRSLLTVGVATPVTGPKPFNVEGIGQFNYRY